MSGVKKYDYSTLTAAIRSYTEVDDSVFTQAIIDEFIMGAEFRIYQELPMDSQRFVQEGTLAADDNTINSPAGALFIRGVEVFNSTSATTGNGSWLEKKDQTYLSEYTDRLTGPEGDRTAQDVTGFPKYYAMFGGADNTTDTSSGGMYLAPTPDANYKFRIYYNKMPNGLGSGTGFNNNTYLSTYFPQGLLYACLVEAYAFLKGPTDMLTYYENRYKNAIQQFAGMQLGRRRRDDYTDGTVRIPVKSPSP
ncbi:MAG: hypothetical protein CMQ85_02960 [Gammaproteobacteria bacterium]|nr:hypothetical protein [Gammaproteobacteria bacterium]|tara:strand:+ start:1754 stop:2503 length:750 start_codon:yes stop_codon:yes gene_type:complete